MDGLVPGLSHQRVFLTGFGDASSSSIFSNMTYDINKQIALKLGARWTRETRSINSTNFIQVFRNPPFVPGVPTPINTAAPFALPPFVVDRFGVPVGTRGNFPLATATASDKKSTTDFSPMAGLEWRPNDDLMFYYTYSEGFKSAVGQIGQTDSGIARPERIQNHEFGAKTTWLDNSLTLNVAGFFYDMEDLQLARTLPAPGGGAGFVNLFENAAQMEGKGLEVEMYWQATDQFSLTGGLSWLDVEFTEYNSVDNFDPNLILNPAAVPTLSFAGNSPRNTPDLAYNIHGEYDFPLANGMFTLSGDISYKSEQFFSEFNNDVEKADAYTFFDASLTYTSADERWSLSAWGKNLTDELVEAGSFTVSLSRTVGRLYLPPRTFGFTAGYNF